MSDPVSVIFLLYVSSIQPRGQILSMCLTLLVLIALIQRTGVVDVVFQKSTGLTSRPHITELVCRPINIIKLKAPLIAVGRGFYSMTMTILSPRVQ